MAVLSITQLKSLQDHLYHRTAGMYIPSVLSCSLRCHNVRAAWPALPDVTFQKSCAWHRIMEVFLAKQQNCVIKSD